MTGMLLAAGRYRIERVLGRGGMAVVYLARDEELQRLVAVKVLAEHLADDDNFRARFLQEARVASRLAHPNVVQLYDAGETEGSPYIVMEYVPGTTVAERGRISHVEVVRLALQACAGLQHAHDAGLVHRDVKPANLLVREDGVLKIADFGIARAAELTRLTQQGTVLGTAAYLSPEQAAGEEVTAATDVYSLGAVVYELLTGRPPYEFESLAELAAQQKSGAITPLRDVEPSGRSGRDARTGARCALQAGVSVRLRSRARRRLRPANRTLARDHDHRAARPQKVPQHVARRHMALDRGRGSRRDARRHPWSSQTRWRQRFGDDSAPGSDPGAAARRDAGGRGAEPQRLASRTFQVARRPRARRAVSRRRR